MPVRINGRTIRNTPEQVSKNMTDIANLFRLLKEKEYTIEDMKIENGHLIIYTYGGETIDAGNMFNGDIDLDGDFSANLLLEKMSGYSFTFENLHADVTLEYAGVSKTGNKLTVAVAGSITPTADIVKNSYVDTGTLHLPADIGAQLYPGIDTNRIIGGACPVMTTSYDTDTVIQCYFYVTKWTNQEFSLTFYNSDKLEAGNTYYFRQEITFLLSENFAL